MACKGKGSKKGGKKGKSGCKGKRLSKEKNSKWN